VCSPLRQDHQGDPAGDDFGVHPRGDIHVDVEDVGLRPARRVRILAAVAGDGDDKGPITDAGDVMNCLSIQQYVDMP